MRRILCGLLLLAWTHPGHAAGDPALARQLTDRGIAQQQRDDHGAALTLFDAALVETPHPKIRYFRAKSLKALGRHAEANQEFEALVDDPEVVKYRPEILAFLAEARAQQEQAKLAAKLEEERRAREKAEADRKEAEKLADEVAISAMRAQRQGLMPSSDVRLKDGAVFGRLVPIRPSLSAEQGEYSGLAHIRHVQGDLSAYRTELTAARILTGIGLLAVSVGAGLYFSEGDKSQDYAGIGVGVGGVVSALAGVVLWPSAPPDPRDDRAAFSPP